MQEMISNAKGSRSEQTRKRIEQTYLNLIFEKKLGAFFISGHTVLPGKGALFPGEYHQGDVLSILWGHL